MPPESLYNNLILAIVYQHNYVLGILCLLADFIIWPLLQIIISCCINIIFELRVIVTFE